jgi:hypothetical protein
VFNPGKPTVLGSHPALEHEMARACSVGPQLAVVCIKAIMGPVGLLSSLFITRAVYYDLACFGFQTGNTMLGYRTLHSVIPGLKLLGWAPRADRRQVQPQVPSNFPLPGPETAVFSV